jgi:hypothetical protein
MPIPQFHEIFLPLLRRSADQSVVMNGTRPKALRPESGFHTERN